MTDCKHRYDDGHNFQSPLFLVASRNGPDDGSTHNNQDDERDHNHDHGRPEEAVVLDVGGVAA